MNNAGPEAIAALYRWVIYAPAPDDVTGGLDSGTTAVWNSNINSRPPSTVVGVHSTTRTRYVFSHSPIVTFTAHNKQKSFDEAYQSGQATALTVTSDNFVHPGVSGLFLGDTAPVYSGTPTLSSDGATHTAPERQAGPYAITVAQGSLTSPLGYSFAFVPGSLTVDDLSPPTVTPSVSGTVGNNGWYTSDVKIGFDVADLGSDLITQDSGCADRSITADQPDTTYTCTATSFGGSTSASTVPIKRDATAPRLTVPAGASATTVGESAVVTWPAATATDALDPAPVTSCDPVSGTSFPVGPTTVTCSALDHAGNTAHASFDVTVHRASVTATFDRPIDPPPTLNVAKLGRVVPVKVTLSLDGEPVLGPSNVPVHLATTQVNCATATGSDSIETYSAGSSNTGNLLRWDATSNRWVYNLDTSSLGSSANVCYRISAYYGGSEEDGTATGGTLAGSFLLQPKR